MGEGTPDPSSPAPPAAAGYPSISLKIWPPTQRSRDAVVQNLVDKLTGDPFIARYGLLAADEAAAAARRIENDAFETAAGDGDAAAVDDDGMETLQVYSREISRRMLESVKARASAKADEKTTSEDN